VHTRSRCLQPSRRELIAPNQLLWSWFNSWYTMHCGTPNIQPTLPNTRPLPPNTHHPTSNRNYSTSNNYYCYPTPAATQLEKKTKKNAATKPNQQVGASLSSELTAKLERAIIQSTGIQGADIMVDRAPCLEAMPIRLRSVIRFWGFGFWVVGFGFWVSCVFAVNGSLP
jgi:hypothetical protein